MEGKRKNHVTSSTWMQSADGALALGMGRIDNGSLPKRSRRQRFLELSCSVRDELQTVKESRTPRRAGALLCPGGILSGRRRNGQCTLRGLVPVLHLRIPGVSRPRVGGLTPWLWSHHGGKSSGGGHGPGYAPGNARTARSGPGLPRLRDRDDAPRTTAPPGQHVKQGWDDSAGTAP